MDSIEQRVKDAIARFVGTADEIKPETRLVEDLGADSIDMVEITMELEDEFDIVITDEDARTLITVQSTVDYITKHVKA